VGQVSTPALFDREQHLVKVDLPPPASVTAENAPAAPVRAEQKPLRPSTSSTPPEVLEISVSRSPEPQQVAVSYQIAENGRKVYFEVVDENTGEVIRQVPPAEVLANAEQIYQFLQKQAKSQKK
jgi:hypothetical protein